MFTSAGKSHHRLDTVLVPLRRVPPLLHEHLHATLRRRDLALQPPDLQIVELPRVPQRLLERAGVRRCLWCAR